MAELCPRQLSRGFDDLELQEVISEGSLDFDEWTSLISKVEKMYPDDMEKICLVYDRFLSKFPLYYGYWRKYVVHMTHLSSIDKVVQVFERAVLSATYSVDMWVDYCSFCMTAFEDPSDIRRLFKRAISFVGKDYLCHTLWDKYIHFEFSQQQWITLAHIYIQTLKFPTKKLHQYYDSFKKLITLLEEDMASQGNSTKELQSESLLDGEISISCKDDNIYCIIKDMMDSSIGLNRLTALKKYRIVGERLYHDACQLDLNISSFEANIRGSYFRVRPLDACELQNWHHYLDFVELQGDFDWAVKLYERCLIVCANYPEYWMRYVDFMETKGGREIANYSLERATEIFLKRVPAIHLFNARFKEQIGDVLAARAAYVQSGAETDSYFVENVISKANMEKRLGNVEAAFNIYKEALEMAAAEEKLHTLPILYVHFSRLKYMSTNSMDAARDILIDGIKNLPESKLLLEELIKFSMVHGGPMHIGVIDSIIAGAISPRPDGSQGLSAKDAEDISSLYLEFVDYCGTIHDVRKALNRHIKLFPDSVRIDIHQQSAKCRRSVNLIKDRREETSVAVPHQLSGDSISDLHVYLPSKDKKVSSAKDTWSDALNAGVALQESHGTRPDDAVSYQLQCMELDDNAQEKGRENTLRVLEEPRDNDTEENVSSADLVVVKEVSPEDSKHFRKKYPEPDVSSENLVHQIASENESLQSSQPYSKENDAYAQGKYRVESEEVKPLSLETLSLKPQERKCPDSVPMTSRECESTPETCKSNDRPVTGGCNANQDNSASAPDSESAQKQIEISSPSSSASHHDQVARRPLPQPRFSRNSGGNWHQMSNVGKFRRGPKYGYRGHGHRKQQQRQQLSPQKSHPVKGGVQMPKTPGYSSQPALPILQGSQGQQQFQATATHTDFVAAHSWPMQNLLVQNSGSQSQSPAEHITPQVSQHAMQGHGQYGHMPNGQSYNQMWQYYYYQQQQQQQQQQFLLQQQQQQQQQQQLQPQQPLLQYQQQLQLQQHYIQFQQQSFQQEQSQQPQQQSQLEHLQLQQPQQVLLQHQQQLHQQHFQQQEPLQQEVPAYPQQLQLSTQVQQEEQEQKQYSLSTTSPHSQSLDYNHYQQGQGANLLQHPGEPELVSSSVPLHSQEKSPQGE